MYLEKENGYLWNKKTKPNSLTYQRLLGIKSDCTNQIIKHIQEHKPLDVQK